MGKHQPKFSELISFLKWEQLAAAMNDLFAIKRKVTGITHEDVAYATHI